MTTGGRLTTPRATHPREPERRLRRGRPALGTTEVLIGLALVVAFFGPGLCYVLAGPRVSGRWIVATAPAASILSIGWAGWLAGRIGRQPGPIALLLLAIALCAVAGLALRHLTGERAACPRPSWGADRRTLGAAAAGLVVGGALTSWLWTRTPGWQDSFPRYWDGTWHGYLLGIVHRTGIVDPEHLVGSTRSCWTGWTTTRPAGTSPSARRSL